MRANEKERTISTLHILTLLSSDPDAMKRESEEKAMSDTPGEMDGGREGAGV